MDSKEVYLLFDGRRKVVSFEPTGNDWKDLRKAIALASEKDDKLGGRLVGREYVFQRLKTKRNGEEVMVDVDEESETEIEDESDVGIVFLPPPTPSQAEEPNQAPILICSEDEVSFPLDGNDTNFESIIVTENASSASEILLCQRQGEESPLVGGSKQLQCARLSCPVEKPATTTRKRGTDEVKHLREPIALGGFTNPSLTGYVKDNLVVANQGKFYEHYGQQLRSWVPDCPVTGVGRTNQSDYDIMAKAICKRHPELLNPKHAKRPHGTVAAQLSIAVRNQRAAELRSRKKAGVSCEDDSPTSESKAQDRPSKKCKRNAGFKVTAASKSNPAIEEEDEKEDGKNKELLNSSYKKGPCTHIHRLMKLTFKNRRKELISLNESRPSVLLTVYPFLEKPDFILYEFSMVVDEIAEDLQGKLENLLASIALWKSLPFTNDAEKLEVISFMYRELKPNRVAKAARDPVMSFEALQKIEGELSTAEEDAPRLVVYISSDNQGACSSFIVADASVQIPLEKASVTRGLLTLLGAYHAWHIGYAPAYFNLLSFLDEELLGHKVKRPNVTYQDFQRKFALHCAK